jgi:hypothetical protein
MPSEYCMSVQQQTHRNEYYLYNSSSVSSLEKCGFELILILLPIDFVSQNKNIALIILIGGCGGGGGGWIMDIYIYIYIYIYIKTSIVVLWVIKQTVEEKKFSEKHTASS